MGISYQGESTSHHCLAGASSPEGIIPAARADSELVLHRSSTPTTLVLRISASSARGFEIKCLGAAVVAIKANFSLVGQWKLLSLGSKRPRTRTVEPRIESLGTEFLVSTSSAEEEPVTEPLGKVEPDRSKKCDPCQKRDGENTSNDGWQSKRDQGSGETDHPEASDDIEGIARHGRLPVLWLKTGQ
jgi:hypothetical protein